MAIIIKYVIFCEGDGCEMQLDYDAIGRVELRRLAKEDGWKRINGKDFCGECAALPAKTEDEP